MNIPTLKAKKPHEPTIWPVVMRLETNLLLAVRQRAATERRTMKAVVTFALQQYLAQADAVPDNDEDRTSARSI